MKKVTIKPSCIEDAAKLLWDLCKEIESFDPEDRTSVENRILLLGRHALSTDNTCSEYPVGLKV